MGDGPHLIFVYGMLRRGQALHRELLRTGAHYLEEGRLQGRLYDLGEYPGAVPSELESEQIHGELYRLDRPAEQLRVLDALEECDPEHPAKGLFERRLAEIRTEAGARAQAWVYFLPAEPRGAPRIRSGDHLNRRGMAG